MHKFIDAISFWLPELCEGMNDLLERALPRERPQYIHSRRPRPSELRVLLTISYRRVEHLVAHVPFAVLSELT